MNEWCGRRGTAKEEILEPRFFVLIDGYIRRGNRSSVYEDSTIRVDAISWVIVEGGFDRYVQNTSVTKFGFSIFSDQGEEALRNRLRLRPVCYLSTRIW